MFSYHRAPSLHYPIEGPSKRSAGIELAPRVLSVYNGLFALQHGTQHNSFFRFIVFPFLFNLLTMLKIINMKIYIIQPSIICHWSKSYRLYSEKTCRLCPVAAARAQAAPAAGPGQGALQPARQLQALSTW
jgi:hypothetical protein